MQSTTQAVKEHCKHCFDVIIATLDNKPLPKFPSNLPKFSTPLFVTWHINTDDLRGCIGTFSSQSIETTLGKYAQISAFQDTRFNPISKPEVPKLSVGVSLLVNFQEGKKAFDWEVGTHGIIIDFKVDGQNYNATFLPEVAGEQQWSVEETLQHLIRKSGYRGNYKNVLDLINLTTYQSSKINMTYAEYQQS